MGVLLQGFFQQSGKGVPSPGDGDVNAAWWWDYLAEQANALCLAGFSAIWLPPITKGASGTLSIGYDVFDDYDLGAKNQKGTIPTRYGTREQLQRCVAIYRANGIDVYLDIVNHQRDGGDDFVYQYLGAAGIVNTGRFPKNADDFHPNVPPDPNVFDSSLSFGDDLSPMNCIPQGYVFNSLIASADWMTRSLDIQGFRFDDTKALSTDFTYPLARSKSLSGKFVVGELISPVGDISNWVFQGMNGAASAFDYPLHFLIASMCNNPGGFDMTQLDDSGFTAAAPNNSVTFVENHDTDSNPGLSPVITNKMMGYAYILTIQGYPSVYYRDYSTDVNCYGLKVPINALIWIHEKLAFGSTQQRWKDYNVFAYERLGAPGLLVGLNNDPAVSRTITVATTFGPNIALHDYTGHGSDVVTDSIGNVSLTIPSCAGGFGYVAYSKAGIKGDFSPKSTKVSQDFDGAEDLDILPATNNATVDVGCVWCDASSPIDIVLTIDQSKWTEDTHVSVLLVAPDGYLFAERTMRVTTPLDTVLHATAGELGYYTLQLQSVGLPSQAVSFSVNVTYLAPSLLNMST